VIENLRWPVPPRAPIIDLVMIETNKIINDFVEALTERAEMSGDGRLEYAMGYLYSTLKALKLQSYELEVLQSDIKYLRFQTRKA